MRIEDLMREKVTVQNELTNAQTEHRECIHSSGARWIGCPEKSALIVVTFCRAPPRPGLALQRENKMKASVGLCGHVCSSLPDAPLNFPC